MPSKAKKSKRITLEVLATMVATGFENTDGNFSNLNDKTETLQSEVSDIKLRLDNLTPKFEVRDLEKRVTRLEHKTGIRRS
jgi:predicted nuclease with TOPRIM domain